jgi:hypothetical protein
MDCWGTNDAESAINEFKTSEMRALVVILALSSIPSIAQNLVLVNAGVSSGSITNKSGNSTLIVGSVGSPTSINVLRSDAQVIHHGMEHPLVMKAKKPEISVGIFPNPTSGPVTIKITGVLKSQPEQLLVLDATGKVVKYQRYTERVDLQDLSAGTYVIRVTTKEQTIQSQPIVLVK